MVVARSLSFLGMICLIFSAGMAQADDLETADTFFKAGKWEEAREAFLKALPELSGEERAHALGRIGYSLQIQHHHEEALPYFQQMLEMKDLSSEDHAYACLRRGYSLRLLNRSDEAIEILEKGIATKDAPSNLLAELYLNCAWEHGKREEPEAALIKFKSIDTIPDVHQNYIASARLSIGRMHQSRKDYQQAVEVFRSIDDLHTVAATNRARARVYRMECEGLLKGDDPFYIRPYVSKTTTETARLYWVSQGDIRGGKVAVFQGDNKVGEFTPEESELQDTICLLHVAQLSGLKAHTRYRYEVSCGDQQESGEFSTPPESGQPISFSVIGDTQSYHEGLQPLLDKLGDDPSDFVLHVGDITDRGNLWGEWKACFFDPGHSYLNDRVFWPVYGNHDGGPYFPGLFELRDHYWYSFDWGDAHIIVLDSYGAGSGGAGRLAQREWLAADLAANKKPWTFVALHVPMVATRRSLQWFGAEDFLPMLEKYEVDIVFSGHHPHYRRYYPIGARGKKPILHITSGGGGGPVGGYMPSPILSQGIDLNHYCKIAIDGPRLTLSAHAINGQEIDRFDIVKDQPLPAASVETTEAKEIIALYQELVSDRTYEMQMQLPAGAKPGEATTLTLDLSKLPRGPLTPESFPEDEVLVVESAADSPWKIERQSFRLRDGAGSFKTIAPDNLDIRDASARPTAKVQVHLERGDRRFAPFEATVRLQVETP